MGAIYLVRHGQASFGHADYDKLSKKGCEQSKILGTQFKTLVQPDQIYSGDMLRHVETASHFLNGFGESTLPVVTHSGFNEFNHVEVLTRYKPEWEDHAVMASDMAKQQIPSQAFQKSFSASVARWISGDFDHEYQESWPQFQSRCTKAMKEVIAQADNAKNIIVFTSGGPVSAILQQVLKLGNKETFAINEMLANTSVSKFLFSGERISIAYLNNFLHLELADSDYVTYR